MLEAPVSRAVASLEAVRAEPRRLVDYFSQFRAAFVAGIVCLILTQAFTLAVPRFLNWATDAILAGDAAGAVRAAGWMVGAALIGAVTRVVSRVLIFNAGRQVEHALRQDLFRHLLAQGRDFFDTMPQGQVMSRMVNDLTQVRLLLGPGLLNLTNTTLVYIVVLPILFYTDWFLTLCALSTLPLLLFLGGVFSRRIYPLTAEAQEKLGKLSSKVQENLSGVMTVRAYRQEDEEERRFLELNEEYLSSSLALARLQGVLFPTMGLAGGLGAVVVFGLSGARIQEGSMTVGGFVEFNAYLAALTWPTIALGWMLSLVQRSRAAMDRVNDIFRCKPSLEDGGHDSTELAAGRGRLEVRGLTFRYPGSPTPALEDVHMTVEPGELVVVVGRTGCGKSTLLEALTRLSPVSDGAIYLDGADVNRLPLSVVRSRMAYAPQDAFLFSRTLEENIRFGRPSASVDEVWTALATACFDVEADAFPEGVQTVIGERGVTLSGGQRQRTALARALIPDRPVLVLDDTLSAVDTETETRILESLLGDKDPETGRRRRTVIMATHRLACAQQADRVVVLDNGRIVEQGTEPELLARGGIYTRMHRRQRLREAIAQEASLVDRKEERP